MSSNSSPDFPPPHTVPAPVQAAAQALVQAVAAARTSAAGDSRPDQYATDLAELAELRGLPFALPLLTAGVGRGAQVQLQDGRFVLDLVSGIGPYVFGHDDPDLLETAAIAAAADVAFQGHVLPGPEYFALTKRLHRLAGPQLAHVWLSLSGSMANENAWKMILQRQAGASRALAFDQAFHGRTLAMAELTDRPEYREGLPVRDAVDRIPFFDPNRPDSVAHSLAALDAAIARHPGQHAAFCFELVQGEGGFQNAPAAFFEALMQRCRDEGIAVWVDEIQTFARMPELFAFRTLGLDDFVDVVTIGKILQGSATLVRADYCPRPKLVAGTWAGSTVGMALGARILERLENEDYLGPDGKIAQLEARLDAALDSLSQRLPGVVTARSGLGAMKAFVPWQGTPEIVQTLVSYALEEGVLVQTAGSHPMKIRFLPPLNLTEKELQLAFAALERAIRRVAQEYDPPAGSSEKSS